MAKKNGNGKRTIFVIVGIIISLASLSFVVVKAYTAGVKGYVQDYTKLKAEIEHQGEGHVAAIDTIKEEGCLPARESKTAMELVKQDIVTIKEDQKEFKEEVKAAQKSISSKLDTLLER
jgi:hypothetical protein